MAGGLISTIVKCWKKTDDETKTLYGEKYITKAVGVIEWMENATWDPMNVVRTMEKAVSLHSPSSQYMAGMDGLTLFPLHRQLPSWLMELLMPNLLLPNPAVMDS
jgi:hypothetical protein